MQVIKEDEVQERSEVAYLRYKRQPNINDCSDCHADWWPYSELAAAAKKEQDNACND